MSGHLPEPSGAAVRWSSAAGTPEAVLTLLDAGRWLPFLDTTPEEARVMMAVPYFAAVDLTRAFLRHGDPRGSHPEEEKNVTVGQGRGEVGHHDTVRGLPLFVLTRIIRASTGSCSGLSGSTVHRLPVMRRIWAR